MSQEQSSKSTGPTQKKTCRVCRNKKWIEWVEIQPQHDSRCMGDGDCSYCPVPVLVQGREPCPVCNKEKTNETNNF